MTWTMGMMMVAGLTVALFVVVLVLALQRTRMVERTDLVVLCVPSKGRPGWTWEVRTDGGVEHGTEKTWGAAQRAIRAAERRVVRRGMPAVPARARTMCTGCLRDVEQCECTTGGIPGISAVAPEPVYAPFEIIPAAPRRAR